MNGYGRGVGLPALLVAGVTATNASASTIHFGTKIDLATSAVEVPHGASQAWGGLAAGWGIVGITPTAPLELLRERTGFGADRSEQEPEHLVAAYAMLFAVDGVRRRIVSDAATSEPENVTAIQGIQSAGGARAAHSGGGTRFVQDDRSDTHAAILGDAPSLLTGSTGAIAPKPERPGLPDTSNILLVPVPTGAGLAGLGLGLVALRRLR